MKGSDIKSLFNYISTIQQTDDGFPQVSDGVKFIINYQTGNCENILINDKPIELNKIYKIVTNSYLADGGDGYKIFNKVIDKYDTLIFTRDVLIDYIINLGGKIKPDKKERIIIMGSVK